MMSEPMVYEDGELMPIKRILATKEIEVNIGGIEYLALLIPKDLAVDIDYRNCPEDDPRVQALIEKIRRGE